MDHATARAGASVSLNRRVTGGIAGGVVGGLVFGAMMAIMGMLTMIAGVVGGESAGVGFLYHMFNSVVIGAIFGLIPAVWVHDYKSGAILGVIYGAAWWVLGPLVLMPLMMGMGVGFAGALTAPMLMSLVGHLIFGLVAGLTYSAYVARR